MNRLQLTCCVSCGIGSSATPEQQIKEQIEKHGEYICLGCEVSFQIILESPKDREVTMDKGYGPPLEMLITDNNIYYFDGPKVAMPDRFLGFGGQWWLIAKDYPGKYGKKRKLMVTNNLWHSRSIPESYSRKLREAGKINSIVISVEPNQLAEFRELLNGIKHF